MRHPQISRHYDEPGLVAPRLEAFSEMRMCGVSCSTVLQWISLVTTDHGTQGDTKEGLYFGREVPADAEEASKPFHGPNQWPPEVRQSPL